MANLCLSENIWLIFDALSDDPSSTCVTLLAAQSMLSADTMVFFNGNQWHASKSIQEWQKHTASIPMRTRYLLFLIWRHSQSNKHYSVEFHKNIIDVYGDFNKNSKGNRNIDARTSEKMQQVFLCVSDISCFLFDVLRNQISTTALNFIKISYMCMVISTKIPKATEILMQGRRKRCSKYFYAYPISPVSYLTSFATKQALQRCIS